MAASVDGNVHVDPRALRGTQITSFKVYSRVRPFIESELRDSTELRSIVEMVGPRTVLLDPKESYQPKAQFEFDDSLWSVPETHKGRVEHAYELRNGQPPNEFTSQRRVYELVAMGCAKEALEGFNTAIMTYGQTGSGKTYTMMGQYDASTVCGGEGEEGLIPRVCKEVFEAVDVARAEQAKKPEGQRGEVTVEVTFVEIYMEKVRDLLDPSLRSSRGANTQGAAAMKEARVRLDPETGPFVEDVTKYRVENWAHCVTLLERGSAQRTTSANNVHLQSSRSHAIFTITLLTQYQIPAKDRFAKAGQKTTAGRINLVDLAGSERGGFTDYVKESAKINTSLLALRRVIDCLVERQNLVLEQMSAEVQGTTPTSAQAAPQVPFRDSVLTWLLSDSIGGNARTTMIAALSPHAKNYGDTLATLQWSSRARNLVTIVKANTSQITAQGFHSKIGDISSSLTSQRLNVDSIRAELADKQALIDKLEAEILALMKRCVGQRNDQSSNHETGAALTIQRYLLRHRHKRLVAQKRNAIDDALVELQRARDDLENAQVAAAASGETHDAARERNNIVKAELKALSDEMHRYDAERGVFEAKHATAVELRRRGDEMLTTQQQEHDQWLETEQAAVAEVASVRERKDGDYQRMKTELAAMEQEVAEFTDEKAAALRDKQAADAAKNSELEDKLKALRQKKQELTAKKADLQRQVDERNKK